MVILIIKLITVLIIIIIITARPSHLGTAAGFEPVTTGVDSNAYCVPAASRGEALGHNQSRRFQLTSTSDDGELCVARRARAAGTPYSR